MLAGAEKSTCPNRARNGKVGGFMSKKVEKTKEQRIKSEYNRLKKIYKGLPAAKLALAEGLPEYTRASAAVM